MSEDTQNQDVVELPCYKPVWAQLVSDILSPILVPTYATALAMWVTPLRSVPEGTRWLVVAMVFIITGLIPLISIGVMQKIGLVSDRAVSHRNQRYIPMSVAAVCYISASLFIGSIGAPMWMKMFFFGAAAATVIGLVITAKWKISAHTTSMGGLAGMMFWFAVSGLADVNVMIMLSSGIILAGLMCTARLLLKRHTFGQVMAGLLLGFVCCFVAMSVK